MKRELGDIIVFAGVFLIIATLLFWVYAITQGAF